MNDFYIARCKLASAMIEYSEYGDQKEAEKLIEQVREMLVRMENENDATAINE